ncbi:MAG TPA: methyltransferase domain-containing protein [Polyangiaceae bacterium]|nr:methyltransferase domain-containing protein [Polyangiaceae bacterium]
MTIDSSFKRARPAPPEHTFEGASAARQSRLPDSNTQAWQPQKYEQRAGFVQSGGVPVVELLAPRAGERILDLGCGTGTLTQTIAEAGAEVLGIDNSESMIQAARAKYPNLAFEIQSGEELTYVDRFDAVFSNAALHWMHRAEDVARGVYRALRPGGRFVAEFGGAKNVHHVRAAVDAAARELGLPIPQPYAPWYFPKLGEYTSLLENAGFDVRFAQHFERPSPMPDQGGESGIASWLDIFARQLFQMVPAAQRARFLAAVEQHARPQLFRDGTWWIDYTRLRLVATRPS